MKYSLHVTLRMILKYLSYILIYKNFLVIKHFTDNTKKEDKRKSVEKIYFMQQWRKIVTIATQMP